MLRTLETSTINKSWLADYNKGSLHVHLSLTIYL